MVEFYGGITCLFCIQPLSTGLTLNTLRTFNASIYVPAFASKKNHMNFKTLQVKVNKSPFILHTLCQTSTDLLVPAAPNLVEDQLNVNFCRA